MKQKLFAGVSLLLAIAFLYTGQRFVMTDDFPKKLLQRAATTAAATTEPTTVPAAPATTTAAPATAEPSTTATTATAAPASTAGTSAAAAASTATRAPAQTQKPTASAAPTSDAASRSTAPSSSAAPTDATKPTASAVPTDLSTHAPLFPPRPQSGFQQAPQDYFKDALFIGDSRTEELMEYGDLPGATFFARVSMSVYNMHKKTCKVNNGIGDISFDSLMAKYQFKKVYIMLGVNEIDYDRTTTVNKYRALVDEIMEAQPDAIIFIQANIHLTQKESDKSSTVNNKAIDDLNEKLSRFADEKTVFYIDPNERFDDGHGAMRAECSGDGTHLKAKYTREWAEWLKTKAIL